MTTKKRTQYNSTLPVREKPIPKGGPVKKVNHARMKRRKTEAFGGGKAEYVRSLPCVVCRVHGLLQTTTTEAAHARSRGAGGKARDLIPLCRAHHWESHTVGARTFENRTGLDLMFVAAKVEMDWQSVLGQSQQPIKEDRNE